MTRPNNPPPENAPQEGPRRPAGHAARGFARRNEPRAKRAGPDGIYVINKPMGISSMTAVEVIRRKAGGAKTGHAGTLDPRATGVLVLALGNATKLISRLMDTDKHYRTTIDLRAFTTTDDLEGEATPVDVAQSPSIEQVRAALSQFVGNIMQRPPQFSAMKVGGKRAYKMARKGETVEIAARPVVVHSIELLHYEWPLVEIAMHCEKGVYVRSLARDLGEALGTGGHCTAIHRSAVGPFTDEFAVPLEDVPQQLKQEHLLTAEQALSVLKS